MGIRSSESSLLAAGLPTLTVAVATGALLTFALAPGAKAPVAQTQLTVTAVTVAVAPAPAPSARRPALLRNAPLTAGSAAAHADAGPESGAGDAENSATHPESSSDHQTAPDTTRAVEPKPVRSGPAPATSEDRQSPPTQQDSPPVQTKPTAEKAARTSRTSPANERARTIAHDVAAAELTRIAKEADSSIDPFEITMRDDQDSSTASFYAETTPEEGLKQFASREAIQAVPDTGALEVQGAEAATSEDGRSLLFVWDASIAQEKTRALELLDFAERYGFDSLAVEAGAIGYGDTDAAATFGSFSSEARSRGIEVFALIGYPWFAVSSAAGLPGQPTSMDEGLALIETIVATGHFDGLVEDSHAYGVTYEESGETRNWLFDEPERAVADLTAYMESAKVLLGDLPLLKTTPFWFDTHPDLVALTSPDGGSTSTVANAVASAADVSVILSYRDGLRGPNGTLELISNEVKMGETIVVVETADLGTRLDYLTFHEEGFETLLEGLAELRSALSGKELFQGTGVHHYNPAFALAETRTNELMRGLFAEESIIIGKDAVIDSYDSGQGWYGDQTSYNNDLGAYIVSDDAVVVSDGTIELGEGSLVHGDVHFMTEESLTVARDARISGSKVEYSLDLTADSLVEVRVDSKENLILQKQQTMSIGGDHELKKLRLKQSAGLTIVGPARIVAIELQMDRGSWIIVDNSQGPVEIVITGEVNADTYTWFSAIDRRPASAPLHYLGTDAIKIGSGSIFVSDIKAPHGTFTLADGARFVGGAQANRIEIGSAAVAHLDVALYRR